MKFKPWQPVTLQDQLVEVGPSQADVNATKFSYLEFRNHGRVRNVTVFNDMLSKLHETQEGDGVFHFVEGQHANGDTASLLVATGRQDGQLYAVDMRSRGLQDAVSNSWRARNAGKLLQALGIALVLIGIPMLLILFGIVLIGGGIAIWNAGRKVSKNMEYQVQLTDQCSAVLARLPGARLI